MQRVVSVAAFAEKLRALAKRTKTLRIQAEVLEKMCEERGILVATSGGKRGNNNTSSPLSHGGGGGGLFCRCRRCVFDPDRRRRRRGTRRRRRRLRGRRDRMTLRLLLRERRRREEEEEEESRSSMTPEVQPTTSSSKILLLRHHPDAIDPSNIIASVVERKKIERLAELREIERVKEGNTASSPHTKLVTAEAERRQILELKKSTKEKNTKSLWTKSYLAR